MKIAWAFNPFDENRKLRTRARVLLKSLETFSRRPELVYASSPAETNLSLAFDIPEQQRFTTYPQGLIRTAADKMGLKNAKVTVIAERQPSLTGSVQNLANYLSRKKIDITMVATHARTGVSRLFMGSFAETLIHYSKSNLLLFNERTRISAKPRKLLFAHDLSSESDKGLRQVMRFAKAWGAELHIIYVPDPAYYFQSHRYANEIAGYKKRVQQDVDRVERTLRSANINGSVLIEVQRRSISTSILLREKALRADMVVVVAKTGRFMTLLGGSITRKVIRSASAPVLIIKS